MASSRSRKLRRLQLGANPKLIAIRWMGQMTVQVMMNRGLRTRPSAPKKADVRAEKSCRHRRRKRGLRKGKVRSRVCHTRRSHSSPAISSKTQSARFVNHRGRKFIWAVSTSNQFRKDCQKYLKVKKFVSTDGKVAKHRPIGIRSRLRRRWVILSQRAKQLDIPYQAAFHRTFWDYLQIECRYDASSTWDTILAGLPRKSEPRSEVGELFSFGEPVGKQPDRSVAETDEVGNSRFSEPVFCKRCHGAGSKPGLGYPLGCRSCYTGHPLYLKEKRDIKARDRAFASRRAKNREE
jgi:hypothetical protein